MKKDTKKMIYLQERDLIDRIAIDEAFIAKRPVSGILEQHILQSMLPKNNYASSFIRILYGDNNCDLPRAFSAVFSYLSAGIDWKAVESNAKPLVSLYFSLSLYSKSPTGKEVEWHHAISQLESIIEKIKSNDSQNDTTSRDIDYLEEIFSTVVNKTSYIRFTTLINILLENWECLSNYTRTYRFLTDIADMQKGIRNDEEARFNFVQILKEISVDWKDF